MKETINLILEPQQIEALIRALKNLKAGLLPEVMIQAPEQGTFVRLLANRIKHGNG